MITLDFETYSDAGYVLTGGRYAPLVSGKPGLLALNASTYAMHPSTEIISMAYEDKLWVPGCSPPQDLFKHIAAGGLLEAHNSLFEFYIWNCVGARLHGWPPLPLAQMRCSAAKARAYGLPGALAKVSAILTPDNQKDKRGKRLIQLLSVPKRPTEKDQTLRRTREAFPELYREMYEYNIQDVKAEQAVSAVMPDLPPPELAAWQLDQIINVRGIQIDADGLAACIKIFEAAQEKYTAELQALTSGQVSTIDEISKGSAGDKWLQSIGYFMSSLDKAHVADALEDMRIPPAARRAFEIRQLLGSSSVKKLYAIERMINNDGRLRDLFAYCGAERTGRFAGRGAQPQNLKNSGPEAATCKVCKLVRAAPVEHCPNCSTQAADLIEWGNTATEAALLCAQFAPDLETFAAQWPDPVGTVASCIRGLLVAAPGHDLICSDYSAIEAVVLAAVAGEEWRLEVFRTHGKIYEASAAKAFDIPVGEIINHKGRTGNHHPLRKKGKVRELANGYGGWINASRNFGATGSDDELKADILKWREESPAIVELWGGQYRKTPGVWEFTPEYYGLEGAAIQAALTPNAWYGYHGIRYYLDPGADVLQCWLPSGRVLYYHAPRLTTGKDPRGLTCWDLSYLGGKGWTRIPTYGSKLTENVIQAIARDILVAAMLRVEAAGYPIVLHVHDEIISEIPQGAGSIEEFEKLMMVREPWFADWPIKAAGGWRGLRYRK